MQRFYLNKFRFKTFERSRLVGAVAPLILHSMNSNLRYLNIAERMQHFSMLKNYLPKLSLRLQSKSLGFLLMTAAPKSAMSTTRI
ncbi:MAG: hypothetical protein RJB25_305 [Bacteroidota bacterium]